MYARSGLGQTLVAPGNPNGGTYSDINCPGTCYMLGNVLDMAILGNRCWPCHNVCPAGTVWDTTNLVCSANPASVNPVTPASSQDTGNGVPQDVCSQALGMSCMTLGIFAAILVAGLVLVKL